MINRIKGWTRYYVGIRKFRPQGNMARGRTSAAILRLPPSPEGETWRGTVRNPDQQGWSTFRQSGDWPPLRRRQSLRRAQGLRPTMSAWREARHQRQPSDCRRVPKGGLGGDSKEHPPQLVLAHCETKRDAWNRSGYLNTVNLL